MPPAGNKWLNDVSELKALAHPLRFRLYYALSAERQATATRLAQMVGEPTALVSYHLRQLAVHGLIEEAAELVRDRRERWWRPTTQGFSWSPSDFEHSPETRTIAATVKRLLVNNQLEHLQQFESTQAQWSGDWIDAAFASDYLLRVTPAQLKQLHEELQAVVQAWVDRTGGDDGAGSEPDAEVPPEQEIEHVMVVMHGVPFRP